MKNQPIIYLALAISLLPVWGNCQQLTIQQIPLSDDVALTQIVGITQDNYGYIWMVEDNGGGLIKYDGVNMVSYKPDINNPNSLSALRLECIFADSKGNIWVGTYQNGLDLYEPELDKFTHFKHDKNDPNSLCSNLIRTLMEDKEGNLWIGTLGGIDKLDIKTRKFIHFHYKGPDAETLSTEHVRAMYQDKEGTIWVGCGSTFRDDNDGATWGSGGLFSVNPKTEEVKKYAHNENDPNSLIDNHVRAIFEDSRGVFYVGTAGDGLHIMDRKKGAFQRCLFDPKNPNKLSRPAVRNTLDFTSDFISFISEDADGQIWIGTFNNGINRYDPQTKTMHWYGPNADENFKNSKYGYWASLKTRDNMLWITAWAPRNVMESLTRISTSSKKVNNTHLNNLVISFSQCPDGTMLYGTRKGIMKQQKNGTYKTILVNPDTFQNKNRILYIEDIHQNNYLISSLSGLFLYNNATEKIERIAYNSTLPNSLLCDTISRTFLESPEKLWIGTTNGLHLMDRTTGKIRHFLYNPLDSTSISANYITSIVKDYRGTLWVATRMNEARADYSSGLNKWDEKTGKFKRYLKKISRVQCIYEDSQKRLWVGSVNYGVYLYNSKTDDFELFSDSTGILNNNSSVYGMVEDFDHNLWFNTDIGILKLNTQNQKVVVYGKSWGINSSLLTSNLYINDKGKIFCGEDAGFYHFFPKDLIQNQSIVPHPFISKFFIGKNIIKHGENKALPLPLSETKEIVLSHDQNNFSFEFNCIDYLTNLADKNLQYKLENYDNYWRKAGYETMANYYNVQPGHYTFRIRVLNLYGNWGEKTIDIIVKPPWYQTWWAYLLFALAAVGLLRSYIVYRSRKLIAENKILEEKVSLRTKQLEQSIEDLKITQSQLIQSEKMASLGELTAGIAHEIQNPLNFVNNFSEVNTELIEEMKAELKAGNHDAALEIADDIAANEQKINHHGKRADTIVKGMLQHSRSSNGVKEPTDINALADEYLRLAYHGLRAKDKSFNATLQTDYDETIGYINLIPQDIGRVILNLITNAFYAVAEKKKQHPEGYEPTVSVSTKKTGGKVEISVKDNGNGIPQKVLDKIFQPFFTTKPTGQGTGLGLSLSYDIVKAHGGELKVETKEGDGATFIIMVNG